MKYTALLVEDDSADPAEWYHLVALFGDVPQIDNRGGDTVVADWIEAMQASMDEKTKVVIGTLAEIQQYGKI